MEKDSRLFHGLSHACLIFLCLLALIPFTLMVISSFTAESEILTNGYQFFPRHFSLDAYRYLWASIPVIARAYGITLLITTVGTTVSLLITVMLGYGISKEDLPGRRVLAFLVFFTLLFNGGLVPTYIIYTQYFHIKNTLWALLVPNLLMNGFNVFLAANYFRTSVPAEVLESAKIDGAGETRAFFRIVIPLSMPILATIGLFNGIAYWNDWNNGLIYLSDPKLYSIQNLLNQMIQNIEAIKTASVAYGAGAAAAMNLPGETVRMAIAVIGVLPILVLYPFFQKFFVRGIVIGAVKG